jgi:hypothetical protein
VNLGTRRAVVSVGAVLLSFAAFGFFVYSGSSLPTQCGTVPCSLGEVLRASSNSVKALSDYAHGVAALMIGQVALMLIWLVRRSRET